MTRLAGFSPEDAERLQQAQAKLEAARRRPEAMVSPLPRPGKRATGGDIAVPFAGATGALVPAHGDHPCVAPAGPCPARLPFPGICDRCAARLRRRARHDAIGPVREQIPEHFRWAEVGIPLLEQRVAGGARVIAQVPPALGKRRNITVVGAMGTGKTSLMCAALRFVLDASIAGTELDFEIATSALFVSAKQFTPEALTPGTKAAKLLEQASAARLLVIDDLGAELSGAGAGTGLAAQRSPPISSLIFDRHNADRWTLVTMSTQLRDPELLADIYGGVARRLLAPDCALVLDLDRFAGLAESTGGPR